MRNLLAANFHALFKSRVFWITLAATALVSAYVVSANYNAEVQASENPIYLNDVFFTVYQFIGVILAAVTSLIIGVEYSDGTIRNKLVVGHRRSEVYLAALGTNLTRRSCSQRFTELSPSPWEAFCWSLPRCRQSSFSHSSAWPPWAPSRSTRSSWAWL